MLLSSPLFWIFFLLSNHYCTTTLREMRGWCLIGVGRLIGVRQELAFGSMFNFFTAVVFISVVFQLFSIVAYSSSQCQTVQNK